MEHGSLESKCICSILLLKILRRCNPDADVFVTTATLRLWCSLYHSCSCLLKYAQSTKSTSYFKSTVAVTQCDVTQQVHVAPVFLPNKELSEYWLLTCLALCLLTMMVIIIITLHCKLPLLSEARFHSNVSV